jgi:hypothetical protein
MTNEMDNSSMAADLESTLTEVNQVIRLASLKGGYVFGGYVRDVLVPREVDPNCSVNFKDVDLWFSSSMMADVFLQEMEDRFIPKPISVDSYPLQRKSYHLNKDGADLPCFNIMISSMFPTNDLDVNLLQCQLLFDATALKCHWSSPWISFSCEELKERIIRKEARLLPAILDLFKEDHRDPAISRQQLFQVERFRTRYLQLGWKIIHQNRMCSEADLQSAVTFKHWLLKVSTGISSCTPGVSILSVPSSSGPPPVRAVPTINGLSSNEWAGTPSTRVVPPIHELTTGPKNIGFTPLGELSSRSRSQRPSFLSMAPGVEGILSIASEMVREMIPPIPDEPSEDSIVASMERLIDNVPIRSIPAEDPCDPIVVPTDFESIAIPVSETSEDAIVTLSDEQILERDRLIASFDAHLAQLRENFIASLP